MYSEPGLTQLLVQRRESASRKSKRRRPFQERRPEAAAITIPHFYDHVTDSHVIAPTGNIVHTCLINRRVKFLVLCCALRIEHASLN